MSRDFLGGWDEKIEHNLTSTELNLFLKLHSEMEREHDTFIRRALLLKDVEHIYFNERLNIFETRYRNGEWIFLRLDGGWI